MRLLAVAIALGVLCPLVPVQAHFVDPVPDGWNDWAMRQWSLAGFRCCNPSVVYLYKGAYRYVYDANGRIIGVTLLLDTGEEIHVPRQRFVDIKPGDPNPTGHSVIWNFAIQDILCWTPPGPLG